MSNNSETINIDSDSETQTSIDSDSETQTSIDTTPTTPSQCPHGLGLQEHGIGSRSDMVIDSFEEDDNMPEDKVISEVARIIEDIENSLVDPTLATLGAEVVVLDMDDIFVYQNDEWLELSDSSSEGSKDGG